jgi:DNA-binding winged helix-turn-helix (wHTH) protein
MQREPFVERFCFEDFELNVQKRALCRGAEEIRLAPKEYAVLLLLVREAGKAVSRERLLAEVWPDTAVGDASLARCVSRLRKHLGVDAIQAMPKFGYRFTPAVTVPVEEQAEVKPEVPDAVLASAGPTIPHRRWIGLSVLVIGFAVALLGMLGLPGREVWTDPETHLMWPRKDNGVGLAEGAADVTREDAIAYCAKLRLYGHGDWRTPTIEELQTLHDPSRSVAGVWGGTRAVYWHVKGGLQLSGGETARDLTVLTDEQPAGKEESYDFSYGRRNYDPAGFKADHRVLCVRGSR